MQRVLRIEAEEIGRALSVIGSRHVLRLVDNVGDGEAMLRRELFHIVEGVLGVGHGIIRHDGDRADANLT